MRFVLGSGRRVAVHRPTPSTGRAHGTSEERYVVLCHSAPGAGRFDPDPVQTRKHGVKLLSVDRPGYGRSDPLGPGQWATVASAADDLAVVLDGHGVERAGVVGWSAGGRVALALAARRPDLVDRVVLVGTPAPDDEVPWMAPDERARLRRLRELPPETAHRELAGRLGPLIPNDPMSAEALWLLAAGPSDEAALRVAGARARLGAMLADAFAQGARGLAADIAGYCLRPWGFEPEAVEAKTLLLYGARDPIAGLRHGRWWQGRLGDARLEVVAGAGHLMVIPTWFRALSHLVHHRDRLRLVAGSRAREVDRFPAA